MFMLDQKEQTLNAGLAIDMDEMGTKVKLIRQQTKEIKMNLNDVKTKHDIQSGELRAMRLRF